MARPRKNAVKDQSSLLTPDNVVEIPVEEQPYPLPAGWKWTYWGACGDFIAGNAFKPIFQGKKGLLYPFYKVGSLKYSDHKGYLYDTENSISEETRKLIKSSIIPEYSIIFAKIGEAIRLNRRSINEKKCCIDNNLMAFVSKKVLYKYAYYLSLQIDLYKYTNATTVPAIRKTDLEKIIFPLPPLDEQQRIVDRIESLFAKLDEAREKAEAVLDGFERRKAAILHKAFTGELTAKWRENKEIDKSSWNEKDFSYVIKKVEAGKNIRCEERPPQKNEIGIVKVSAVTWGFFNENESKTCSNISLYNKNIQIKAGDFLFSRANTIQLVGNCVIVGGINKKLMLSDKILRLTINENVYDKYILYFSISTIYRNQIINLASGNQDGMRNVSQKKLLKIRILLPMKEEQQEIVRILDTLLEKERQVKEAAEEVLERIDLMKKSILAKAFRGELS